MKILNGEFHNIGSVATKNKVRGCCPEGCIAGPGNTRMEEMSRLYRRMEALMNFIIILTLCNLYLLYAYVPTKLHLNLLN